MPFNPALDPPGTRPCPACGCCRFGLCMIASRDMSECSSMSANPAQTCGCPCSAVLRRPLISVVPHLWAEDGGPCIRCHAARTADVVPNCWYHPHEAGRGRLCKWCGLHVAAADTPLDCAGMPRAMPITSAAAFLAQVAGFLGVQELGP